MASVAEQSKKKLTNSGRSVDKSKDVKSPSLEDNTMIHPIDTASLKAWQVPASLVTAEEQFSLLLDSLLELHEHRWVFVAWDSTCHVFDSFDEADAAAELCGFTDSQYVVRQVSLCELTE